MNESEEKPHASSFEPRRSSRLLGQSTSSSTSGSPKKTKRQRNAGKSSKISLNNTKRCGLLEVPLDIMQELGHYLLPLELLQLARTCKSIRRVLMSMSSATIWKAARRRCGLNLDPPQCISEPSYAYMAFNSTCELCHKTPGNKYWQENMVLCSFCYQSSIICSGLELASLTIKTLPGSITNALRSKFYTTQFSRPLAVRYSKEYNELASPQEEATWVSTTLERIKDVDQHSERFVAWVRSRFEERVKKDHLLMRRAEHELLQQGWGQFHHPDSISYTITIAIRRVLDEIEIEDVDEAWTLLENRLPDLLAPHKAEKILHDGLEIINSAYQAHCLETSVPQLLPNGYDLAIHPSLRFILDDVDQPLKKFSERIRAAASKETLATAIETWVTATRQKALAQLRSDLKNPLLEESILDLATTLFYCAGCEGVLNYRKAIKHSCAFESRNESTAYRRLCTNVDAGKSLTSWNSNPVISFNKWYHEATVDFLKVLDPHCDPGTVKYTELDDQDLLVQCLDCRQTRKQAADNLRQTFDWVHAIHHTRDIHNLRRPSQVNWKVPGPQGQALIRAERDAKIAQGLQ